MSQASLIVKNSIKFHEKVRRLCLPLTDIFGITDFWYGRTTPDGLHRTVETNIDYLDSYFTDKHYSKNPLFRNPRNFKKGFYVYQHLNDQEALQSFNFLGNKLRSLPYIGYILKSTPEEFVRFGVGIDPQQTHKRDLLINNLYLLEEFFCYFYKEAIEILLKAEEYPVDLKAELGSDFFYLMKDELNDNEDRCRFLADIYNVNFNDVKQLSPREIECLKLLNCGLTSAEIGHKLFISQRTVESHLVNVKNKLNCTTKSELFKFTRILEKSGYFDF